MANIWLSGENGLRRALISIIVSYMEKSGEGVYFNWFSGFYFRC